jgi:L-seryl-tRNA(Ser) seleniumtransferase
MLGLLTAVERYVTIDWRERAEEYERIVDRWVARLDHRPGLHASRIFPNEAGQPTPRCRITFGDEARMTGPDAARQLWEGNPRIAVAVDGPDAISITPELLEPGEEAVLLERVEALVGAAAPVA